MKTKSLVFVIPLAALAFGAAAAAQEPAPRERALAAAVANQWTVAEPLLEQLAAAEPTDPDVCSQLSRRRLDENRTKEAVELMTRATTAAPERSDLQAQLGHTLGRRIGEVAFVQQAIIAAKMHAAYEKAVKLDPNNVGGWIGLARYSLTAPEIAGGSVEKAAQYAREVDQRAPFPGAMLLGEVAERSGKPDEAVAQYRRATGLNAGDAWAWTSLGRACAAAGKSDEAKKAFGTALERSPGFKPAEEGLKALTAAASS